MAINKNHEFEELNGVKCGIVEKNASRLRVAFLKPLLEFNRFSVVVAASPPPKASAIPKPEPSPQPSSVAEALAKVNPAVAEALAKETSQPQPPLLPETFTIGVTDVTFNPTNAIFGRLLHTPDGHVVTLAYWQQKEAISRDEIPYFDN